ncbi:hypothetical protein GCM10007111_20850 [Virgibacillus kapii]|nr:hypothetical protein GCM10007111_20850 [Virgibacillus kapii]
MILFHTRQTKLKGGNDMAKGKTKTKNKSKEEINDMKNQNKYKRNRPPGN